MSVQELPPAWVLKRIKLVNGGVHSQRFRALAFWQAAEKRLEIVNLGMDSRRAGYP